VLVGQPGLSGIVPKGDRRDCEFPLNVWNGHDDLLNAVDSDTLEASDGSTATGAVHGPHEGRRALLIRRGGARKKYIHIVYHITSLG
jgi:hypothetical protein